MRTINVNGIDYLYKIGRSYIRITNPDNKSVAVDLSTLTGLSWDEIDRGKRKIYFSVTPSIIKEYIEKNLGASIF